MLYSASWCAPCKQFLPVLEELYHRVNRRGKGRFDIVWVSINRDETEIDFLHYFRSMPWLAVPQDQIPLVLENTADVFKLAGIPCLVLLDGTSSSVITLDGRQHVLDDRFGVQFPWRSKSLLNWVSTSVQRKVSGLVTEAKAQVLRALHPRRILLAVRDVLAGAVTLAIELLRSVYSFILNRQNLGSKGLHL